MPLFHYAFEAMASTCTLQLWTASEAQGRAAADAAIADAHRIERKYSRYRDDSLTARINRGAGGEPVAIDAETAALLRYADRCHALSGGRFDLTAGVLRRAWDLRASPARVPDAATLAAALALVDWPGVAWSESAIRLPRAGMQIDFGGIGKEYAADRAATICNEQGIAHGLVNLGGDVRVVGPQPDGAPWRVGIVAPRPKTQRAGEAIAWIELAEGAIATSGDYERYVEIDGRRYCHVIDARTGWPVDAWQSVSVVAPLCVLAGSYATIAMLLAQDAPAFLDGEGVAYLAIAADGSVHGTAAGTHGPAAGGY